ncbi:unnamed protein product [Clavelina lepadiformis]|uniref:Uncharacterized protein n=1 Tax=Clavelina lepadiformis TaxID=159417 RepID=A0ABP0FP17_CLALP
MRGLSVEHHVVFFQRLLVNISFSHVYENQGQIFFPFFPLSETKKQYLNLDKLRMSLKSDSTCAQRITDADVWKKENDQS